MWECGVAVSVCLRHPTGAGTEDLDYLQGRLLATAVCGGGGPLRPHFVANPLAKNARKSVIVDGMLVFLGQKERERTSNTIMGSVLGRFFDPQIAEYHCVCVIFGAFWTFKMPDSSGF